MRQLITKKLLVSTLVVSAFAVLTLVPTVASAATTLRFGHVNGSGELAADLFQEFADKVAQKTKGELMIKVFPSEQLGREVELIQQVKSGALDISAPSMPTLSTLAPALEIASIPFLWTDWVQAQKVISGPAFQPIFDELADKHGVVMLSKIWYWGWRNLTTGSKAVSRPEDIVGMKIRVSESPVWVEMIKALGAAPTVTSFSEVYTALQMKLVDGQENPIPTIYTRKFYEVQGYLTMTRHMLQNNTVIINKHSLEKLSPNFQKVLFEEIATLSEKNSRGQQEREKSMLEEIRKTGKTVIIDNPDRAAFAAKMGPVYKNLESRWGAENLRRIRAAVDATK